MNFLKKLFSRKSKKSGWTRCPNCKVKDHEMIWKNLENGSYSMTCTNCGFISQWIDGPGLMLYVGEYKND